MNPFLIQPALANALAVGRGVVGTLGAVMGAGGAKAAASATSPADFQGAMSLLNAQGGVGVNVRSLAGLSPNALQNQIASLPPQQQIALAQQLVGTSVGVSDPSGRIVEGTAQKLQIENGVPVFQVNGNSYSLANLVSVKPTA